MTAKRRPTGKTIDVDRIISIGRDRKPGRSTVRVRDAEGCSPFRVPIARLAAAHAALEDEAQRRTKP